MNFDFQVLGEVEKGRSAQGGSYTLTATPSKNVRIQHLVVELLGANVGDEITAFSAMSNGNKVIAITKAMPADKNKAKLTSVSKENPDLIQFSHARLWSMLDGSKQHNTIWQVNKNGIEKDGRTFFLLENPEKIDKIARTKKVQESADLINPLVEDSVL